MLGTPRLWGDVASRHLQLIVNSFWDFRLNAERTLTILSGAERAVYLYCDQNRPLHQIRSFLSERETDLPLEDS